MWSQHNTNKPGTRGLQSSRTKTPHTGSVCAVSGHVTGPRPGALGTGPWHSGVAANSPTSRPLLPPLSLFDRQPIRRSLPPFALGILVAGGRLLDWPSPCCSPIWPTRSQQCHNRPPIYTPSNTPRPPLPCLLSPPARWERTHARCLINTETKPALPGSLRGVLRDIQLSHGLSQNGSRGGRGEGGRRGGAGEGDQTGNKRDKSCKKNQNNNNPKKHSGRNPAADKNNTRGRKKLIRQRRKQGNRSKDGTAVYRAKA